MISIDNNVLDEIELFPKKDWIYINSPDFDPCSEFKYYTETLFQVPSGKYILHTTWCINELWFEDEIRDGEMTKDKLGHCEKYIVLSEDQAEKWLDDMVDGKRIDIKYSDLIRKEALEMMDFVFANKAHREYFNEATIPEGMDFGCTEPETAAIIYLVTYAASEENIPLSKVYDKKTQRVRIEVLSEEKHSQRFEQIMLLAYNLSTGYDEYDGKRLRNIYEFYSFMSCDLPYILQALTWRFPTLMDEPHEY